MTDITRQVKFYSLEGRLEEKFWDIWDKIGKISIHLDAIFKYVAQYGYYLLSRQGNLGNIGTSFFHLPPPVSEIFLVNHPWNITDDLLKKKPEYKTLNLQVKNCKTSVLRWRRKPPQAKILKIYVLKGLKMVRRRRIFLLKYGRPIFGLDPPPPP